MTIPSEQRCVKVAVFAPKFTCHPGMNISTVTISLSKVRHRRQGGQRDD